MFPVLHLDPVLRPASLIRSIAALRHQPSSPILHAARNSSRQKQLWTDLTGLERGDEDPVRSAGEQ
jgi:hypothetical protein